MMVRIRSGRNGRRDGQDKGIVVVIDKKKALHRQLPVKKRLEQLCEKKAIREDTEASDGVSS